MSTELIMVLVVAGVILFTVASTKYALWQIGRKTKGWF